MKQIITAEQLEEMSDNAYEKYLDWMIKNNYTQGFGRDHIVPMNIGQMIEFLNENQEYQFHIMRRTVDWKILVGDLHYGKVLGKELCDSLWEACKDILSEEKEINGKSN